MPLSVSGPVAKSLGFGTLWLVRIQGWVSFALRPLAKILGIRGLANVLAKLQTQGLPVDEIPLRFFFTTWEAMTQILRERGWNAYFGKKRDCGHGELTLIHRRCSSASLGDVEGSPVVALRLADDRLLRICNIYANSGVGADIEQDRNAYFAKVDRFAW